VRITLSSPLTVNPTQVAKLQVRHTAIDHQARVAVVFLDMLDASGAVVESRSVTLNGTQVAAWVDNLRDTIVSRLLAKLGVTGSIET
jgi:hypothetical protein